MQEAIQLANLASNLGGLVALAVCLWLLLARRDAWQDRLVEAFRTETALDRDLYRQDIQEERTIYRNAVAAERAEHAHHREEDHKYAEARHAAVISQLTRIESDVRAVRRLCEEEGDEATT